MSRDLLSGASNFVFAKELHHEGNWSYMRSHQADVGTEELGINNATAMPAHLLWNYRNFDGRYSDDEEDMEQKLVK